MEQLHRRLEFPGARGQKLVARLDRPAGEPRAWALFAHCFTCSKDSKATRTTQAIAIPKVAGAWRDCRGRRADAAGAKSDRPIERVTGLGQRVTATDRVTAYRKSDGGYRNE